MARPHVKRGDVVVVIAGEDRGKSGKVLSVDTVNERVTVEGVNVRKRAVRRSMQNPQGGISEQECPVHVSNVMGQEKYEARQAKHQDKKDEK
ncbi:MAG: 50S ribosomal protein L24 [Candidatus Pacebacteria bacterium]|nr:50S ribosomal protein L24 [Candidatus Paceibacterota bacterium]